MKFILNENINLICMCIIFHKQYLYTKYENKTVVIISFKISFWYRLFILFYFIFFYLLTDIIFIK